MANRDYEQELNKQGYEFIAGSDEAGRGPIAGPLVVAAVIFPNDYLNPEIDDSKKLSAKKREELFEVIKKEALAYYIQILSLEEIDKYNIYEASRQGMLRCFEKINHRIDAALTDAMPLTGLAFPVQALVNGDGLSQTVAAASILAKVTRDQLMLEYDKQYPEYDFKNNMGYGTKKHLLAIEEHGICPLHRRSFEPIKSLLSKQMKLNI